MPQLSPSAGGHYHHDHQNPDHARRQGVPAFKDAADFISVPFHEENYDGETRTVNEVSTSRPVGPYLISTEYEWGETSIKPKYREVMDRISAGLSGMPGHGFWPVDNSLVRDDEGYVKVYEFCDLSFVVKVPAHLQGPRYCFE